MRKAIDFIGSLVGYVIAAFIFACVICGITAGGLAIYELIASSSIGAERAEEITTHIKEDIMPFVILAITVVAFVFILFVQKWFNKAVEKIIDKLKSVFGYGIAVTLIAGALTIFGFIAALICGGAEINGYYADKTSTNYTYNSDNDSIVATCVDVERVFGNSKNDDSLSVGVLDTKEDGNFLQFYSVEEDEAVMTDKLIEKKKYKLGIFVEDKGTHFLNEKIDGERLATTSDLDQALDVYVEKKQDGTFTIYYYVLDENGERVKNDNGYDKTKYLNMNYKNGKGNDISQFMKDTILPVIIYTSTTLVLLGLFIMYMRKEHALTPDKKKNSKHEGEM